MRGTNQRDHSRSIVIVAALIVIIVILSGGRVHAAAIDESEPNDSKVTANQITVGRDVYGEEDYQYPFDD